MPRLRFLCRRHISSYCRIWVIAKRYCTLCCMNICTHSVRPHHICGRVSFILLFCMLRCVFVCVWSLCINAVCTLYAARVPAGKLTDRNSSDWCSPLLYHFAVDKIHSRTYFLKSNLKRNKNRKNEWIKINKFNCGNKWNSKYTHDRVPSALWNVVLLCGGGGGGCFVAIKECGTWRGTHVCICYDVGSI